MISAPARLAPSAIAVPRDADTFLTIREAWRYLRKHVGAAAPALESWKSYMRPSRRAAGRLPPGLPVPVRLPGRKHILFRLSDLDDWIAAQRGEAAAQVAKQTGE